LCSELRELGWIEGRTSRARSNTAGLRDIPNATPRSRPSLQLQHDQEQRGWNGAGNPEQALSRKVDIL
jgi:hypothetical protein